MRPALRIREARMWMRNIVTGRRASGATLAQSASSGRLTFGLRRPAEPASSRSPWHVVQKSFAAAIVLLVVGVRPQLAMAAPCTGDSEPTGAFWSACLTVGTNSALTGYRGTSGGVTGYGSLSDTSLPSSRTVHTISHFSAAGGVLGFGFVSSVASTVVADWRFHYGASTVDFSAGTRTANGRTWQWSLSAAPWSDGDTVTVALSGGNRPPVFSGTEDIINAPPGVGVSLPMAESDFSDPDGDTLTYSIAWNRDDVYVPNFTGWTKGSTNRVSLRHKSACDLVRLKPFPTIPLRTVATITATDPDGETAEAKLTYLARLSSAACPTGDLQTVAASNNGKTLTLTFSQDLAAASAEDRTALRQAFALHGFYYQGAPVGVMSPRSVAVPGDKTVTLTLSQPVPRGQEVKVAYDPDGVPVAARLRRSTNDNPVWPFSTTLSGAAPASAGALVSNTGHPTRDNLSFGNDQAQSFTTGSDHAYTLTRVDIALATLSGTKPTFNVSIRKDSSNTPGTSLGTLTSPSSISTGLNTFTAPAGGIDLAPGTTYFVVIDVTANANSRIQTRETNRDDEDSGAATGWSIGNGYHRRIASSGGSWATDSNSLKIAVYGTVKPPAVLRKAQVEGKELGLTFDKALDATSTPAGSVFSVSRGGTTSVGTGTASISGKQVRVTLASELGTGKTAMVHYDRGAAANPLRGASGQFVSFITNFEATVLDQAAPALSSAVTWGTDKLALYYDEALDVGSVPAAGDFTVTQLGSSVTVNSVTMSERAVTLTLGAVAALSVSYTAGTNPIRDLAGTNAANLTNETPVFKGLNSTGAPVLAETDPATAEGRTLTLTFDKDLDPASVPGKEAFTVSDEWRSVDSVTVSGKKVELGLLRAEQPCNPTFTVSYTKPSSDPLQNLWGTDVATFSGEAVTYGGGRDVRRRLAGPTDSRQHRHQGQAAVRHERAAAGVVVLGVGLGRAGDGHRRGVRPG